MKKIIIDYLRLVLQTGRFVQRRSDIATSAKVHKWIESRGWADPDKSIEDVAHDIGVSRERLCWFCSEFIGMPFLTLRKRLRIEEARRLIRENPGFPLYAIGELVGITNKSNFRTQFREVTGMSPAEFRESELKH